MVPEANTPLSALLIAAEELQSVCSDLQWRFCLIGGLAVLRWGRPRVTRDVDLSLWTGFEAEPLYVDQLLEEFLPRIADAREFALVNRVVLLKSSNGTPLDIALASAPFEERMQDRASSFLFADACQLITASAEDLIVSKAFANRPQDWLDIQGITTLRKDDLDWTQIEDELRPLAEIKEEPEILDRLSQVRQQA